MRLRIRENLGINRERSRELAGLTEARDPTPEALGPDLVPGFYQVSGRVSAKIG